MTELLTPKLDLVFKTLFSQDTELLVDLINAVLNRPDKERITSVELLNPGIIPETVMQKFIILDIRATDETGRQYDIEMQVRRYDDYNQRTIYYLSRMYAEQLKTGEEYDTLKKDEASLLGAARRQGEKIGLEKGQQIGLEKGQKIGLEKGQKIGLEQGARNNAINTAAKLLQIGVLSDEQIADVTGLGQEDVKALQKEAD